jgi:hypothetical protein
MGFSRILTLEEGPVRHGRSVHGLPGSLRCLASRRGIDQSLQDDAVAAAVWRMNFFAF